MSQLEQAPLSKSVAYAFGWFFLLAAISSLVAFFVLILPVVTDPESSFIYQQMSVYLSADEPLVLAAGAENQSVFTISSDGRLLITFFLAILGFIPGYILSVGLYHLAESQIFMPMPMSFSKVATVFFFILSMCATASFLAIRKLRDANPADMF